MTYFPDRPHANCGDYADGYFAELAKAVATVDRAALSAAANLLIERVKQGGRIYSCGNGGSAAIANHLVCDHMKGIANGTGLRPKVHSFSTTVELITAIANDIGTEEMFAFQVAAQVEEGDVLVAISSSGTSPNIIRAVEEAKARDVYVIALTGFTGGQTAEIADISLHVAADNYGVVEDVHQSLMHILAQYVRHAHLDDASQLGLVKF